MDIRRDGFFGQLVIDGVKEPKAHHGSVMRIVSESLKDLQETRVRTSSDGESEIVIRIRNKPFDTSKESAEFLDKAAQVSNLVDSQEIMKPADGEHYDAFLARLKAEGYPDASALMIAADWYGLEQDINLKRWLTDTKAQRFRELNSRDEAYQSAIPSEYTTLKDYVIREYPEFVTDLTFRTA